MDTDDRPPKRIKIYSNDIGSLEHNPTKQDVNDNGAAVNAARHTEISQTSAKGSPKVLSQGQKGTRNTQKNNKIVSGKTALRTFSQPSVLCVGDRGFFVTSDKGCEKKALLELHDILQDYFEARGIDASGSQISQGSTEAQGLTSKPDDASSYSQKGIEADIASELAELRNAGQTGLGVTGPQNLKPMQLITLDIPCVSFLRLPTRTTVDPVEIIHRLCLEASNPQIPQRSRFVKRLTPISTLAKTLRQGLDTVSEEVLPRHFGPDKEGNIKSVKFAIRPTVRENEQLDRDLIIRPVADRIQELGKAAHKVDLKKYEKGVIVEVYRGWIGMCVVDNAGQQGQQPGYEELRRFNLSEIYAKR